MYTPVVSAVARRSPHVVSRLALRATAILVAGLAIVVAHLPATSRAETQTPTVLAVPLAKKSKGKSMKALIKASKKKNLKAFKKRLAKLKKSPALVQITKYANVRRYSLYMDYFAAVSTKKRVDKLVKKTKGKHFVISGTSSRPKVLLVSNVDPNGIGFVSQAVPAEITCWQGWVAFWAWWVGAEMTCTAFGAIVGAGMSPTGPMALAGGVIAGSACNGLMAYLQQQFIDFETACQNVPSPESHEAVHARPLVSIVNGRVA